MFTRCVLIGVLTLAADAPALAQSNDPLATTYQALVDAYQKGETRPVEDVSAWSTGDIQRMLAPAASRGPKFAEAAAMLHTEAAIRLADMKAAERAADHLTAAAALAQSLPESEEMFTERFFAFMPSVFLAHGDVASARQWVERGLQLFEFSAPLRIRAGIVEEFAAHLADPEGTNPAEAPRAMAEREYRRAIQREDRSVEAHLRLGRLLSLTGREDEAARHLAMAIEQGTARGRYLAHLFVGAMLARRGDRSGARAAYQRAMQVLPSSQTPYIALSHLEESAGNAMESRALLEKLAQMRDDSTADPWWIFQNGGIDMDLLQWLVAYVRQ